MKLNHLDLQVSDVPRSVALFERLFGLEPKSNRASPAIAILGDDAGFTLVLQRRRGSEKYPEGFHFGFLLDDVASVHAFRARANSVEGIELSEIIENGRGTLVYLRTWDGIMIEVSCQRKRARQIA